MKPQTCEYIVRQNIEVKGTTTKIKTLQIPKSQDLKRREWQHDDRPTQKIGFFRNICSIKTEETHVPNDLENFKGWFVWINLPLGYQSIP